MPRFIDISGTHPIAAAAIARQAIGADVYVNALEFGATGDGVTDDTVALQEWLDYLVTNNRQGWLPNGTYKITDTLVAAPGNGWAIHGESYNYTALSQATNNIPILTIGGPSHSYQLRNLVFTYASTQSSSNTNANAIVLDGDPGASTTDTSYFAQFEYLFFTKGYYGIKVSEGMYAPWGNEFDALGMRNMSGGLMDMSDVLAGGPNNRWGRCTLECNDAVGPIFKNLRCYNSTIDAIEILLANNSPQIITSIMPTFGLDVGSIKVEIASYTGAGNKYLLSFPLYSNVRIGSVKISGTTAVFTPSSGIVAIVAMAGGADSGGSLEIGSILADATSLSGTCVAVIGGSDKSRIRVGHVVLSGGWTFQSTSSTTTGDYATVGSWVNDALSGDKGDANYTATVGDPNVVHFDTAFTAQRTITLPASSSNDLCAGLYYDLVFDGAVNGANTALIKHGSTTLRTQAIDKKRLRYVWRRAGSGSGSWVLTDVADIDTTPAADSNNTASTLVLRNESGNFTAGTITAALSGNATTATTATFVTAGLPDNTGTTMNCRVIRNGNTVSLQDGMYIGYGNTGSGATRIYGGGDTSTSVDVGSGGKLTVGGTVELGHASDTTVSRTSAGQIAVEGNPVGIKVAVPASASATGVVGQWAADSSWIYVCTAANTWVRGALATW